MFQVFQHIRHNCMNLSQLLSLLKIVTLSNLDVACAHELSDDGKCSFDDF